jgi:hypothetical protein
LLWDDTKKATKKQSTKLLGSVSWFVGHHYGYWFFEPTSRVRDNG